MTSARVEVGGAVIGQVGHGLLVLACAMRGDDEATARRLAAKIAKLRIFRDEEGRMNRSILDTGGAALLVSQFTLAADTRSGNRPGFSASAPPEEGERLVGVLARTLTEEGIEIATGRFGAEMAVTLTNDGPVTIWLDTER